MLEQESNESGDIRLGAVGENVKLVQRSLGLNEDGVFGPGTEQAVKEFQQRSGYEPDGIVGPQTWKALKGNVEGLGETASINNDDSLAKNLGRGIEPQQGNFIQGFAPETATNKTLLDENWIYTIQIKRLPFEVSLYLFRPGNAGKTVLAFHLYLTK